MSKIYLCCCCDPYVGYQMPDVGETDIQKQLAIPIEASKLIGHSSQSKVYRNLFKSMDVAVKKVNEEVIQQMNMIQCDDLMMELEFAWRLNHPNTLQINQFQLQNGQLIVLMELMQYNLHQYIHEMHRDQDIQMYDIVMIVKQIASGLDYLHRLNPLKRVQHGNLHPKNVLIAFNSIVKISDFTLKRMIQHCVEKFSFNDVQSLHSVYVAPEAAVGQEILFSSDIYSLGVIGWELWTRKIPHQNQNFVLDNAPRFYEKLIQDCIQLDQHERPTAAQVVDICNGYLHDLQM